MRSRLMWEVEPSRRSCRSWRNPLLIANAMTSEATPAATPAMEMPVIMPITAWRRLARKYRDATKSSKRIEAISCQPSAFSQIGLLRGVAILALSECGGRDARPPYLVLWHIRKAMAIAGDPKLEGWNAFAHRDFTVYEFALFLIECALEMMSVAVGWQVYEITKRPLDLGLVGLAQFLPGIFLFLASGHVADRFDRRKLLMACYGGFAVCAALLLEIAWRGSHSAHGSIYLIYGVLVLLGTVRSFAGPATRVMLPLLVPEEHFPSAVAWNASVFQGATILGPMAGGLIFTVFILT